MGSVRFAPMAESFVDGLCDSGIRNTGNTGQQQRYSHHGSAFAGVFPSVCFRRKSDAGVLEALDDFICGMYGGILCSQSLPGKNDIY